MAVNVPWHKKRSKRAFIFQERIIEFTAIVAIKR